MTAGGPEPAGRSGTGVLGWRDPAWNHLVKRYAPQAPRAVLSNWKGFPCPSCAQPLQYWRDDERGQEDGTVAVLLVCPGRHCWQEKLSLETLHSSLFVERRRDLETGEAPVPPPERPGP